MEARVGSLSRGAGERERRLIVVVDGAAPLAARTSPLRRLATALRESMTLVVLTAERSQLPAVCEVVVEVAATGDVVVLEPGVVPRRAVMAGCSAEVACSIATRLARWRDPELHAAGADLDRSVELVDLVGAQAFDSDAIAASWRRGGRDPRPIATLGRAADGIVEIDLVADGPHALVAGTTGAGKSELLRTLVAALALGSSPAALSFVLIDYKGGSAFDACAGLPHVAGIVTDLDDRLAARVLRSLDAELRRRERLLRAANAADLTVYRANPGNRQIPRLVIVVDEFAALAAELPEFLSTLVNVAQRGRSLGIHLVLATQRPSGVLSDDIRANTNLRIALRVQDDADAVDVVGQTGPARFARHAPGRAALRLGTEEVLVFQTARCTSPVRSPSDEARTRLIVRAGGPGRASGAEPQSVDPADGARWTAGGGGRTMLDQLVQAAVVAAAVIVAERKEASPRRATLTGPGGPGSRHCRPSWRSRTYRRGWSGSSTIRIARSSAPIAGRRPTVTSCWRGRSGVARRRRSPPWRMHWPPAARPRHCTSTPSTREPAPPSTACSAICADCRTSAPSSAWRREPAGAASSTGSTASSTTVPRERLPRPRSSS